MDNSGNSSRPNARVAAGGVFHLPKVTYSKETHDFLKLLMEEQKMTILQRNRINSFLRSGDPLPLPKPKRATTTNCRPSIDCMRTQAARRRSLQAIKASGVLDRDKFIPKKYESWEHKKARLQEEMSGLKHYTSDDERALLSKANQRGPPQHPHTDPIDEILQEIDERIEWLNEMEKLGEGHKYKQMIQNEIAERLRLIKSLDTDGVPTNAKARAPKQQTH